MCCYLLLFLCYWDHTCLYCHGIYIPAYITLLRAVPTDLPAQRLTLLVAPAALLGLPTCSACLPACLPQDWNLPVSHHWNCCYTLCIYHRSALAFTHPFLPRFWNRSGLPCPCLPPPPFCATCGSSCDWTPLPVPAGSTPVPACPLPLWSLQGACLCLYTALPSNMYATTTLLPHLCPFMCCRTLYACP